MTSHDVIIPSHTVLPQWGIPQCVVFPDETGPRGAGGGVRGLQGEGLLDGQEQVCQLLYVVGYIIYCIPDFSFIWSVEFKNLPISKYYTSICVAM